MKEYIWVAVNGDGIENVLAYEGSRDEEAQAIAKAIGCFAIRIYPSTLEQLIKAME